jgi:hypothetical protein
MRCAAAYAILIMLLLAWPVPCTAGQAPPCRPEHRGVSPAGAPLAGAAILTVTIESPACSVQVTESEKGEAEFCGTVAIQMLRAQRVSVALTATVDTGWTSSVNPDNIIFTGSGSQPFVATVVVNAGEAAGMVGTLTVRAETADTTLKSSDEATTTVTVLSYYRINIDCSNNHRVISPGGGTDFVFKVYNAGNAPDTFVLQIEGQKDLAASGWEVKVSPAVLESVPRGESREVKVSVKAPLRWDLSLTLNEPKVFTLNGTSRGSVEAQSSTPSQSYPMRIDQKGVNMPAAAMLTLLVVALVAALALLVRSVRRRRRLRQARQGDEKDEPDRRSGKTPKRRNDGQHGGRRR